MIVVELTPKTRTISRTPLPLSVMSTIWCLTAGSRPLSWYCNRYKAHRQTAIAPFLEYTVPLSHPQQQQSEEHFAWSADATVDLILASTMIPGRPPSCQGLRA